MWLSSIRHIVDIIYMNIDYENNGICEIFKRIPPLLRMNRQSQPLLLSHLTPKFLIQDNNYPIVSKQVFGSSLVLCLVLCLYPIHHRQILGILKLE